MKKTLCLLLALSALPIQAETPQPQGSADLVDEARRIAARFAGRLKPQLQAALQSGGPAHAIGICAETAPAIARELSEETRWRVTRVSLKPRNSSARPDAWESARLKNFDEIAARGEAPQIVGEWVEGEFRAIQPQMVQGLCLVCHGQSQDPAVSAALRQHYPQDRATGYALGQVRGAISLTAPP